MIGRQNCDKTSERDVVALADGSLPASKRPRVERAVADSPALKARLAAQRRALAAIRDASGEPAPGVLRARLELARDPRPALSPRPAPGLWRPNVARLGIGGLAAAALATLALLVLGGGGSVEPTVAAAATLGTRVPLAPATGSWNDHGTLPGISVAGVEFPDWNRHFGYKPTGVRYDQLGGRAATTVFYTRGEQRIAYTIVSGSALPAGAPARGAAWSGTRLATFWTSGRLVVTWLRNGHTCVLTSVSTPLSTMERLASWQASVPEY